jgi:hypothetical protein
MQQPPQSADPTPFVVRINGRRFAANRSWRIPVGEFTRSVARNETFQGVSVMMGVVVFHSVDEAPRVKMGWYQRHARHSVQRGARG